MPESQIPNFALWLMPAAAINPVLKMDSRSGKGGEAWWWPERSWLERTFPYWPGGAGWGLQIGAELTDFIFILNNGGRGGARSRATATSKLGADDAAAGPVDAICKWWSRRPRRFILTAGARDYSPVFRWRVRSSARKNGE
jgi:hypothetical protein